MMNADEFADQFASFYGARPRIFRAPGRVNLMGEHTDYNDGFVLPAAIGFSTYIGVSPRSDGRLLIRSQEFPELCEFDLSRLPRRRTGSWCDYILGVAATLLQRSIELRGANLLIHGEVPIGAGLSSSAALEVSSALALLSQSEAYLPLPEIARLCRQAENTFVGARVGIMDQFVSCLGKAGHALLLDCRTLDFEFAALPPTIRLVVCNTMVRHEIGASMYNQRRDECEEGVRFFARLDPNIRALRDVSLDLLTQRAAGLRPVIVKRCSHVIQENQRTLEAARALRDGDLLRVGQLMGASHRSLRDLYEVSCRELDVMVESAQSLPGFIGGRMTGGGFGGCTVNLVHADQAAEFAERISERFRRFTGVTPQIYVCSPEDGAREITAL